ncbi:unnamed protein product [Hermetia illucens]|uniref:Chitin-binding type-2 domain-containing protein n=1 Tax=Hermetia illucens TaxID=343691 RepID=A0A7R8UKL4_HERIL|nr:uncharacterized protein LOC119649120 [Hermetia illucens]CAD7082224.1 unnamed protein product [Hermetia illucens]
MQLVNIPTSSLLLLVFGIFQGDVLVKAVNEFCGVLGTLSGVICVTETEYKLSLGDSEVYACPITMVCANHPEICVRNGDPDCMLSKTCALCHNGSDSTCIAEKNYVKCVDGQLGTSIQYCPASKPYCSMRYNNSGAINAVCTNLVQQIACDGSQGTTPTPEPPTEPSVPEPPENQECANIGKFPDKTDTSCRGYYYCYPDENANGKQIISKMDFLCPIKTFYNAVTEKCVKQPANFKCENV